MKKTYTGGCQCGKVRYEAQADIGEVVTCNCSRCRKLGPLLSAVAMSDFKLLAGQNEVTDEFKDVLGLKIVQGRWFGREDDGASYLPVVISAEMASPRARPMPT